ncbi:MAG: hypothetical protein KDD67_11950 [Ignavibacteriae bacterium]|nr:hypothetical protein [Ignavibacteriota bacterium]MCB9214913.1 hypothetical protein [Ignavibacteria bacterium]
MKRSSTKFSLILFLAFLGFMLSLLTLSAQEVDSTEKSSPVTFHGSATLSGEFYNYSDPSGEFTARRPESVARFLLRTELGVGDFFSLPINIMVSSDESGVVTPLTGSPTLGQFLQNQMNTISISPRFGWAQFHLGSHFPENTGMAFDGTQLFGGGVSLRPGKFRFAASAGISQRGIEVDTAAGIRGAFQQKAFVGRIGYGDEGGQSVGFGLSVARIQDDTTSIRPVTQVRILEIPDTGTLSKPLPIVERHNLMPVPVEGASASARLYVPIIEGLSVTGEAALCNYTRDMASDPLDEDIPLLGEILTERIGSRVDYALNASIAFNRPTFGVTANALHVGAGFVTLGNPYNQSDKEEFTLNPRVSLLTNRVNVSGSIGYRTNNLSGTQLEKMTQLIGGANISAQVTERLSLDAGYNNMGISSNNPVDTFQLNNNTQSFTFSPTYMIPGESATHVISAQLGLDNYRDNNTIVGEGNNTTSRTLGGFYSLSFTSMPLSTSLALYNTAQQMASGDLTITSLSIGAGYRLLENKLTPSLNISASQSSREGSEPEQRISFRLGAGWEITRMLRLQASASIDQNAYNRNSGNYSVTENFFQASLTQQF